MGLVGSGGAGGDYSKKGSFPKASKRVVDEAGVVCTIGGAYEVHSLKKGK